ncbi:hypothetical protein ACFOQM_12320 [Paenibacillus sp. GCM10012307]|uniref:Uncharacterized protein n=1 Tax=Paenibacillus roseus TaxID=2798579 RepID=A0A934J7C8_9BACL|nr:hypothetical protein [Paenibacillus roseus]MBJ6362076.1 hypothetical protein [Paenibacillus roseus]
MKKELFKEVPFGKGIAKITVTAFVEAVDLDGQLTGNSKVITTSNVEIVSGDGKLLERRASFANILTYDEGSCTLYEKFNLDTTKEYTRVGDRVLTIGGEAGRAINNAIEEMKAELLKSFGKKTDAEKQKEEAIAEAKEVVQQAQKEGIESLMTKQEIKAWRHRFNLLYNEGGEGYIPSRVSREEYEKSLAILKESGEYHE